MFVELRIREYDARISGYTTNDSLFNTDDIARVIQCVDDSSYTNIVTSDGKIHTIAEPYRDVARKIKEARLERSFET